MAKYSDGLDRVTLALALPARRHILSRLTEGPATSSELAHLVGIGLPTIAKHVAVLAGAGLITSEKSGRVVTHYFRGDGFAELQGWIAARSDFWQNQLDALQHHLGAPHES